jgi:hypothetical protein
MPSVPCVEGLFAARARLEIQAVSHPLAAFSSNRMADRLITHVLSGGIDSS